jgi:hypothetical protein
MEAIMPALLDLERYPLDRPHSGSCRALVRRCRDALVRDGLFNLSGFVKASHLPGVLDVLRPRIAREAFTHRREHNIYFRASVDGLPAEHGALRRFSTTNHTLCGDQVEGTGLLDLHRWAPFADFLARVMGKERLFPMEDPLACVNVMAYRDGEALNWHFDRSEFTTTLLLQAPERGGEFEYAKDLRDDDDPNYEGVARLLAGEMPTTVMPLEAGTLNVFRGKNTAHRVTTVGGASDRIIAVFSYYDRPSVRFSPEEQRGFYGRVA